MTLHPADPPADATDPIGYFGMLVGDDDSLPLFEAAVALGQIEEPEIDLQTVLDQVDMLGARLARRVSAQASTQDRLLTLNQCFYDELGFGVNTNHYYDPANSYLHRLLATRRGIPVSLAVLYMELAGHCGLLARGVGFPGHFLVRIGSASPGIIVDPANGRQMGAAALEERLEAVRGQRAQSDSAAATLAEALRPSTPREVLTRMLNNLRAIFHADEDWPRAYEVQRRLAVLLPSDWAARRDLALVCVQLGRHEEGIDHLTSYLAHGGQVPDAQALREQLLRWQAARRPTLH